MNSEAHTQNQSRAYLGDGRLEDVMALIQLLGLAADVQRTEKSIQGERGLMSKPQSADSWTTIARIHCEFFRVYPSTGEDGPVISLVSRRLLSPEDRKAFPPEFVKGLMESAIRLHENQLQRQQILRVAWVGGALLALSSMATLVSAIVPIWKR
jgi:hypothetical protein